MLVSIALHQHLKRLNTYKGANGNKETKQISIRGIMFSA